MPEPDDDPEFVGDAESPPILITIWVGPPGRVDLLHTGDAEFESEEPVVIRDVDAGPSADNA
jgi:hypothetical protein